MATTGPDIRYGLAERHEQAKQFYDRLRANRDGQPCLLRQHGYTVEARPLTVRFITRGAQVTFIDPWELLADDPTVTVTVTGSWDYDTLAMVVEGLLTQLAGTP